MKLYKVRLLRRLFLPLLRFAARDFTMRHPYVRDVRIQLNSYKHKGYWYHRKAREREEMFLFSQLIKPGDHVVEVGGHIGFVSVYFMKLVGPDGRVSVFEPGSNNLTYLRKNLQLAKRRLGADVTLIEKAVGYCVGEIHFFEESLTGQNNSAVIDFEGYRRSASAAFTRGGGTVMRKVPITKLDEQFGDDNVDFIKIDVEGFELNVLLGGAGLIDRCKPALMVEVQASETDIFSFFNDRGWKMFTNKGELVSSPDQLRGNIFVLHRAKHSQIIDSAFRNAFYV